MDEDKEPCCESCGKGEPCEGEREDVSGSEPLSTGWTVAASLALVMLGALIGGKYVKF